MMKRNYWTFCKLAGVVGLAMLIAYSKCLAAQNSQKFPLVYSSFTGGYVPLWIAAEEHLGRRYGLELDPIYAGRVRPQQLLLSGDAQYVAHTGTGTVDSHVHGQNDFVIIASFVNTTGISIFSTESVRNVRDLRGKVVGVGRPGSITDVLARYILKNKFGLDPNRDVKVLSLGEPVNVLPALEQKVIQAGVLTTPTRLAARKLGYRELVDVDSLGIKYPYVGISTLKSTVKNKRELTANFIRLLSEGIHIYKTDKQASLRVMRKYLRGMNEEILDETYNYFSSRSEKLPYPTLDGVKNVLDMLAEQNPQAKNINPGDVIDASFVKELDDSGFMKQLYK
jgi:ABC-type nitrate/sulfonate/bicarbonate transport system substrate-binding protein